jgi:hypothetical protein
MHARILTLVCAWLVWTLVAAGSALAQAAPPDETPTPAPDAAACADQDVCPAPQPQVEVAGVQSSADDAREPGESEPFIINDGFGD